MGMSMHVVGFVPPDEKWEKMKQAYYACKELGINPPNEVDQFFNNVAPDPNGVKVNIEAATKEWSDEDRKGLEVEVDKIPKHVKVIRFYNSW